MLRLLENILASPITWGIFAIIALAVAFSGKVSVSASTTLLWVAYGMVVFGAYRAEILLHFDGAIRLLIIVCIASGAAAGTLAMQRWLTTPTSAADGSGVRATSSSPNQSTGTAAIAPAIVIPAAPKKDGGGRRDPMPRPRAVAPTAATATRPSLAPEASTDQVVAWGRGLLQHLHEIREEFDRESDDLMRRRHEALSNPTQLEFLDANYKSARIRATQKYKDCCITDAIKYRDALLQRLPGGWRSETVFPLYVRMADQSEDTFRSGPKFIEMIIGDLDRMTVGVARPLAAIPNVRLREKTEQLSKDLWDFQQETRTRYRAASNQGELEEISRNFDTTYRRKYQEEAVALRDELVIRLGRIPPERWGDVSYQQVNNISEIDTIRKDLGLLAAQLPDH